MLYVQRLVTDSEKENILDSKVKTRCIVGSPTQGVVDYLEVVIDNCSRYFMMIVQGVEGYMVLVEILERHAHSLIKNENSISMYESATAPRVNHIYHVSKVFAF